MNYLSASAGGETTLACPKCGFEQERTAECARCGIIFAKYKPPIEMTENVAPSGGATTKAAQASVTSGLVRMLSWSSLAVTATVLFLILKQGPPLTVRTDPEAAARVADKMAQLQLAMQSNQRHVATLDEAELNQWMRENLAIASSAEAQQAGIPVPAGHEATVKEVRSAMKDIRMHLMGNQLQAYARFAMYGKEVSLQLDGALETHGGYIRSDRRLENRLPSHSLLHLDRVVHELFDSPQNREKVQLPDGIESVRIENSSLIIATR